MGETGFPPMSPSCRAAVATGVAAPPGEARLRPPQLVRPKREKTLVRRVRVGRPRRRDVSQLPQSSVDKFRCRTPSHVEKPRPARSQRERSAVRGVGP
jgi:hypothetical protein